MRRQLRQVAFKIIDSKKSKYFTPLSDVFYEILKS